MYDNLKKINVSSEILCSSLEFNQTLKDIGYLFETLIKNNLFKI